MKKSEIKKQFEALLKLAEKFKLKSLEFDSMLKEYYGEEHYSDHDINEIIDAIDYEIEYLSFDRFDELMREINSNCDDRDIFDDDSWVHDSDIGNKG